MFSIGKYAFQKKTIPILTIGTGRAQVRVCPTKNLKDRELCPTFAAHFAAAVRSGVHANVPLNERPSLIGESA